MFISVLFDRPFAGGFGNITSYLRWCAAFFLQAWLLTLWRKRKDVSDANWSQWGEKEKSLAATVFEDTLIQMIAFNPNIVYQISSGLWRMLKSVSLFFSGQYIASTTNGNTDMNSSTSSETNLVQRRVG